MGLVAYLILLVLSGVIVGALGYLVRRSRGGSLTDPGRPPRDRQSRR
jgi:hypothetical protein